MSAKPKQLVRDAHNIVGTMLDGLVQSQPHLALVANDNVVLHRDYEAIKLRQVTLLSGGGSGHEPAHAGYIGEGMLTGVICGNVFASPTTHQVLVAIRHMAGPKGCLLIVKNYTGDRLNFGLAVEQAKAEGFLVDMVVIGEDVAVVNANAGRRGLSGTVLIHKVAGAAAAAGADLNNIVDTVNRISASDALGTIGVALRPCTLPGQAGPSRSLGENEMELGLGIHGEPGIERCELQDAPVLTDRMVQRLADALTLTTGSAIVLMINNLGTATTMELFVIAKHAIEALKTRGVEVKRVLVGSFMTALDMNGFSLTTWKIASGDANLLAYFDAPTTATGWNYSPFAATDKPQIVQPLHKAGGHPVYQRPAQLTKTGTIVEKAIRAACEQLIRREGDLTAWDAKVGDGDCGITFRNAAIAILADLADKYPLNDPPATLRAIAHSVSKAAGGTSGVLYTIFFTAAAVQMEALHQDTAPAWGASFRAGIDAVQRYGGAKEGSRTMIDALLPAERALGDPQSLTGNDLVTHLAAVAVAAEAGAEKTRTIPTSQAFGRTGYVEEAHGVDVPDPGAMAAAVWIRAVVDVLTKP